MTSSPAKRVFIVGATSAIGSEVTFELGRAGFRVLGAGRTPEKIKRLAVEAGEGHEFFRWDFQEPFECLPEPVTKGERFHGAVFCTGVSPLVPVIACTPQMLEETFRLNFFSIYGTVRQLILEKRMAEGASFVFVSSLAAESPSAGQLAYAASKACLETLVKVLVQEFSAKKKWRFNVVSPGQIESPMVDRGTEILGVETIARHKEIYPFGFGRTLQVAQLVQFLLSSSKSEFINGANIRIDGGAGVVTPF